MTESHRKKIHIKLSLAAFIERSAHTICHVRNHIARALTSHTLCYYVDSQCFPSPIKYCIKNLHSNFATIYQLEFNRASNSDIVISINVLISASPTPSVSHRFHYPRLSRNEAYIVSAELIKHLYNV